MIKRIDLVIGTTNASWTLYKMQFYTKVDGAWAMFDQGECISYSGDSAVFENMTVTCQRKYSNTSAIKLIFSGGTSTSNVFSNGGNANDTMSITFNEGLKVLSGIYYAASSNFTKNVKFKIYDENDRLIYSDDSPSLVSGTKPANYYLYKTKGLELMKVYPVGTIGTVETNDNTQIKDVYQVDGITVTQNTPQDTDIKYLISFDGRKTYKTYKDGVWSDVDISNSSNIIVQGLTKAELEAINSQQFNEGITDNKTIDVLTGMVTNSEYVTPSISQVKVLYLKIV